MKLKTCYQLVKEIGVSLAIVGATIISPLVASEPLSDEKQSESVSQLDWHFAGKHKLSNSHSTLSLSEERMVVFGKDAQKFSELCGNPDDSSLEAVVLAGDAGSIVYFSSHNEGYVSLDDWNKMDSKELLATVIENTEKTNLIRRKNGTPEIHVVGWMHVL